MKSTVAVLLMAAALSLNDFGFEFGTWRTHDWYDCYGTSIVIPFWGGGGNLEYVDLRCPNRYVGELTLRTYDPQTRQWTVIAGVAAPIFAE
jgi:hypothetical protein